MPPPCCSVAHRSIRSCEGRALRVSRERKREGDTGAGAIVSILAITSLAKSFRAGNAGCFARVRVLRGLDLTLWQGEVVALDGASGSGKSTLLRCAAGLLRPDAGSIHWFGARGCPGERVDYVCDAPATPARASLVCDGARERGLSGERGDLYASLERMLPLRARLLLVDDLPLVGALERRLVLGLLERHARTGAAILFTANEELASARIVSRVTTLTNGALVQRRKRSAVRIAASSPASRARASARSTYGRSLRSPQ